MITVLLRRLVVLVVGVVLATCGVGAAGLLAGLEVPVLHAGPLSLDPAAVSTWLALPIAVVGLLLGWGFVALALWPRRAPRLATLSLPSTIADDGLVVRVAPVTLEKLVGFEARQVNGVRKVTSTVQADDAGWKVRCELVVWRGQSMRDVSEQVTERVRDALHRHTGVNLSTLEIDVSLAPEPVTRVD